MPQNDQREALWTELKGLAHKGLRHFRYATICILRPTLPRARARDFCHKKTACGPSGRVPPASPGDSLQPGIDTWEYCSLPPCRLSRVKYRAVFAAQISALACGILDTGHNVPSLCSAANGKPIGQRHGSRLRSTMIRHIAACTASEIVATFHGAPPRTPAAPKSQYTALCILSPCKKPLPAIGRGRYAVNIPVRRPSAEPECEIYPAMDVAALPVLVPRFAGHAQEQLYPPAALFRPVRPPARPQTAF